MDATGTQRNWPEPARRYVPSGRDSASVHLCERFQGRQEPLLDFPPNLLGRRRVPVGHTPSSQYPS